MIPEIPGWEDPLKKLARRVDKLTIAFSIILVVLFAIMVDGRRTMVPTNAVLRAGQDSIRAEIRRAVQPRYIVVDTCLEGSQ